ncbi:ABC transporter substrate-binding protein [Nitratireductor sp. StC3]|nr:ABC transporter substrate-binding protein [Nitratireductor sp. StC3]
MMSARKTVIAAFSLALTFAGLGVSHAQEEVRIVVTGSSTIAPLMMDIAQRYEAAHPGVQVDVQTGGSSRGLSDVRRKLADIGMVSRALGADENDVAATRIAWDGVALIVHAQNPLERLSDDQVRAIYTGQATRWEAFGSWDGPITVVSKAEGRSTLGIFLDYLDLDIRDIRAHTIIGDNEQAVKVVAGNPRAVGYISIGAAEYHASAMTPIRAIALGAVAPTSANVANGSYPVRRELNLVTYPDPAAPVEAFLRFASGQQVHDLISDHYFSPASN